MKTAAVLKPAMLFAAGTVATTAHAAPTVVATNYGAGYAGPTPITIGNATSPQYSFAKNGTFFSPDADYRITGNGTAQITSTAQSSAFIPTADTQFASYAITGRPNLELASIDATAGVLDAPAGDQYFGLKFDIGQQNYFGYAKVNADGDTISEIGYQAASAVPEPAAWALMIAGFGVVGAATRRRRQSSAAAATA